MILLHHLRIGRSEFTVWLLEELALDYELKIYDRTELGRAPAALRAAHPLGKSPVIEDDGVTLAESGAIAWHLMERYDADGRFSPPPLSEKARRAEWLQWFHYSEASGFAPMMLKLLLSRESEPKPALISAFAKAETQLHLNYVCDFMADKPFLLGDRLALPDFGLSFVLQLANRVGELASYPTLVAYLERNMRLPAFQRAMARTGG